MPQLVASIGAQICYLAFNKACVDLMIITNVAAVFDILAVTTLVIRKLQCSFLVGSKVRDTEMNLDSL